VPGVHILYLTHYFTPENNAPATRVHGMAREWARSGHRVTVLTGAPNVPSGIVYEGYVNKLFREEWVDGIRTVRVWTSLAAGRGRVRRGLDYLSYLAAAGAAGPLLRPRADVVIATSPQFSAGWAGWPVARAHGAPFVLEIRDIWPDSIVAVGALEHGRIVRALGRLEHALYDGADHIVAVDDGHRMSMIRKGIGPSKISVVADGLDVELFEPREPDRGLRMRLGFSPETFVITFTGTIGTASGLEVALGAARRLKAKGRDDIAFLLVGDGAVRSDLQEQARAEGLTNVVFAGLVPRTELPAYLASSDACLVHFRKDDPFGTILPSELLEDAAMERPILLGFGGDARAMLAEADCGVAFEPSGDEELAAAAERLAAAPAVERRRLGENGRRYVLERFDRRRLAHDYLEILERVRSRHRLGRR
jgi:glycosyltransferase involved in cell wall biosynthesis